MIARFLLAALAVWIASTPLAADDNLRVVKLSVTPAGPPQPLLRYRFAPAQRQLVEGNAAALYYRAIVVLLQTPREKNDQVQISDWLGLPPAELPRDEARKTLSRHSTELDEARLAARRRSAAWDLPLRDEGVATLLPEIQESRALARLMALEARLAILEGDYAAASLALENMYTMARRVGESGTLISMLVGIAIQGLAADEVQHWIAQEGSPNAYWALTCLPPSVGNLADSLESEDLWIEGSVPYADLLDKAILTSDQLDEMAREMGSLASLEWMNAGFQVELASGKQVDVRVPAQAALLPIVLRAYPVCKRQLLESDMDREMVEGMQPLQVVMLRWVQVYRELLDEIVVWARHAPVETRQAAEQIDERFHELAGRPEAALANFMLPAVNAANRAVLRGDQQLAMLRVVEALRLYAAAHDGRLPEALADITEVPVPHDPATNGPFEYRLEGKTALLRSAEKGAVIPETQFKITVRQ
ncbi:MAG: hypothetical protein DWQ37_04355 [Planctomycetota bacterium]|nr:MAG: hypothetical protein DWQ37_04355 [Planctomycetota bacterium]